MVPAHEFIAAGGRPAPTVDLLGRLSIRANEAPRDAAKQGPSAGGTPNWNGPAGMIPYLRRAAPGTPVTRDLLEQIARMGSVPQRLAQQLGTADPAAQARLLMGRR